MKNIVRDYTATTFITIAIFILALVFIVYWINFSAFSVSMTNSEWGSFGSYIGGVAGAFLSFVTIVLLALTLRHQTESSRLSQFENSFFELYNMFREVSGRMDGNVKSSSEDIHVGGYCEGIEYIDALSKYLKKEFSGVNTLVRQTDRHAEHGSKKANKKQMLSEIDDVYDELYKGKESNLGHYFRSLYNIFKFIDESEIKNKEKYFNLLQAFLSDSELHLLFYNGIGRHGRDKFLSILDNYSFLENIHPKGEEFEEHFQMFYPETYKNYLEKPVHQLNKSG